MGEYLDLVKSSGKDMMIMKKLYEKPMMLCDIFTADEYVAACGETVETTYQFKCDAVALGKAVCMDNGDGVPGLDDILYSVLNYGAILGYEPCNAGLEETHPITDRDDVVLGWIYDPTDEKWSLTPDKVYVWTNGGTNIHCTRDIASVENWKYNQRS